MRKLKHTNSILEYFEYFCQTSLKSILIIFSYTLSKLVHFLTHSVLCLFVSTCTVFIFSFPIHSFITLASKYCHYLSTQLSTVCLFNKVLFN